MKSSNAMIETTVVSMGVLLKPVAKAQIKSAHDEKQNYGSNEDQVVHEMANTG
jgi:hypothetical protein